MSKLPYELTSELGMWRGLSPGNEPGGSEDDSRQPAAGSESDRRAAIVSECLDLLHEVWPAEAREIGDDSANQAFDATPEAGWIFDAQPMAGSDCEASRSERPKRFGRFLIDAQLGRGGHGLVFRGVDPLLQRPAAIKVPHPDSLASAELRARFVEESRTLARLEHPNLLPILEAGTVGPVCYLVTPFCAGPSLAEWLRRQGEPVACESAARLVRDLARTVAYVHSRGILHRDIKPSNVLLEPIELASESAAPPEFGFTPKLADFGLAKHVSSGATRTATGALLGTPAYMAPEQAEGRHADVGVGTDVYALGAMLYELLTGQPPYRGESIVETLRLISEGRLTPPRRLRADLPRDLSAICLKCMELEPSRRFRSADDLADDLTAFLECRPVQARACGPLARLLKWTRRRPLAASLAAALVVSAMGGLTVVGWQWRRAEAHRQKAEETFSIAHGAIKRLHDVLFEENGYDTPEFYALQRTVLDAAMPYYRQLLEIRSSDAQLRVDVADVYVRLGHMAHAQGSLGEALEWFKMAAEVWQSLVEEDPGNREYRYSIGKAHGRVGQLLRKQNAEEAGERLRQAAAIQEGLIAEYPSFRRARWELSEVLNTLIWLHLDRHEIAQANRMADRAVEVLIQIPPEKRETRPMIRRLLAEACVISAEARLAAGKPAESAGFCRDAAEITCRLVARNQDMPSSANTLCQSFQLLAKLSAITGDADESIANYRGAIGVCNALVSRYPNIPKYGQKLIQLHAELAAENARQGRFDEAVRVQQEALRDIEKRNANSAIVSQIRFGLAEAYLGWARARNAKGERLSAARDCENAISFYRQSLQDTDQSATAERKLAYALRFLANLKEVTRDNQQAAELYREAIELQRRVVAKSPDISAYRTELADYYTALATQQRRQRSYDEAVRLYRQAEGLLEQLVRESPRAAPYRLRLIRCHYLTAYAYQLLGRLDEASAALNRGKELVLALTPEAKHSLADEKYRIAEALHMAAAVRIATGELDGGIENLWVCELSQTAAP